MKGAGADLAAGLLGKNGSVAGAAGFCAGLEPESRCEV